MKISRTTTVGLIACASLATVGCLKSQDQAGNQEQAVLGPNSHRLEVLDWDHYVVPGREWNTFAKMNPGYVLAVSRVMQYSVGRDNSTTESTKNWRLEVRKIIETSCTNEEGENLHDNRNVFKFWGKETCFKHDPSFTKPSSDFQIKTLKEISEDGTIAENTSSGIFFQNELIGALVDFICRDTEIGRRFQEFSNDGKTPSSRTYSVVGCDLPQLVNGKFTGKVITLKRQQAAPSKAPQQSNPAQAVPATPMPNPPLSSTAR
jgi:hypothetical protein